ncbi:MAG TPA: hypothetical protein VN680_13585, partial [Burkholderiaceae bacterium]|nr:hypothetical protein [Burkholderiaceae bacterium]
VVAADDEQERLLADLLQRQLRHLQGLPAGLLHADPQQHARAQLALGIGDVRARGDGAAGGRRTMKAFIRTTRRAAGVAITGAGWTVLMSQWWRLG